MGKLLSVIVPSYNMEGYLAKCLESLVVADAEILKKLEVIVVNDGSTDHTSEIAHQFKSRYPDVYTVIDKSNGHYGSCVNEGLKHVTAEFVRILDADDYFNTVEFEKFLKSLCKIQFDGIDLVISSYVRKDNKGCIIGGWECALTPFQTYPFDSIIPFAEQMSLPAITYKSDILRQINYKQTEGICYTDTEWWYAPMTKVQRICFLPYTTYCYFIGRTGQSVAKEATVKNFWMYTDILRKMVNYYCLCETDETHREYLYQCLIRFIFIIYNVIIAYLPVRRILREFDVIDKIVVSVPKVYESSDQLFLSRSLNMRYVHFFRNHKFLRKPYLLILKCYLACTTIMKSRRRATV